MPTTPAMRSSSWIANVLESVYSCTWETICTASAVAEDSSCSACSMTPPSPTSSYSPAIASHHNVQHDDDEPVEDYPPHMLKHNDSMSTNGMDVDMEQMMQQFRYSSSERALAAKQIHDHETSSLPSLAASGASYGDDASSLSSTQQDQMHSRNPKGTTSRRKKSTCTALIDPSRLVARRQLRQYSENSILDRDSTYEASTNPRFASVPTHIQATF